MGNSQTEPQNELIWGEKSGWWLERVRLQTPAGATVEKGVVRHPGAVVMVPLEATAVGWDVVMIRQYRLPLNQTILELPAGTRGWEEEWLACAQRELREETGYRAANFTEIGDIWPTPGGSTEVMRLYMARGLQRDPLPQDFDEEIEVVRLPLREVHTMALEGQLQDAKSVVGILRTHHLLQPQVD